MIDGTGGTPLSDAAVVVDGQRIEAVGPRDTVAIPPGAEMVDLSGMTLLPGLIDCHDHLGHTGYGLMDRWELDAPASLRHIRTAQVLKDTLDMGYTAVKDAGGLDNGFRLAVEEGLIPGPRLMVSISLISPTGGLADIRSPSGHCCPGPVNLNLPSGVADGPDAVRAKVREMARFGADVIKCASTGGASSREGHGPCDREFTQAELGALVEEAHELGLLVMCHALGGPGLRRALEAGVDSIEHGTYLNQDPQLLFMMAEKGIFFVPTLLVYDFHRENVREFVKVRARALYADHMESIHKAIVAGVKVVAGTDSGGWGHPSNAGELRCMVEEAGMSPMQALVAATGHAAQCLGMEKDIGTVETGKLADLVVVDGAPLEDITLLLNMDRIKMVVKGGAIHADRRVPAPAGVKIAAD